MISMLQNPDTMYSANNVDHKPTQTACVHVHCYLFPVWIHSLFKLTAFLGRPVVLGFKLQAEADNQTGVFLASLLPKFPACTQGITAQTCSGQHCSQNF